MRREKNSKILLDNKYRADKEKYRRDDKNGKRTLENRE